MNARFRLQKLQNRSFERETLRFKPQENIGDRETRKVPHHLHKILESGGEVSVAMSLTLNITAPKCVLFQLSERLRIADGH